MKVEITLEVLEAALEACRTAAQHAEAEAAAYTRCAAGPDMRPEEQAALKRLTAQQQQVAAAHRATAEALAYAREAAAQEAGRIMAREGGRAR